MPRKGPVAERDVLTMINVQFEASNTPYQQNDG